MTKKTIKETASAGATGGGAIAVNPSRLGDKESFSKFLMKFYSRVKNKMEMKPVVMSRTLTEFYDLSDIVSRLKGVEGSDVKKDNTVTYGVEDDDGNIMKISVKKDQAKDFEYRLARDMADAKDNKLSGSKTNVSLAELLYNLKDEFDVVDVEFPTIPKDVVYMADKATKGADTSEMEENDTVDDTNLEGNDNLDVSDENADFVMNGEEGDLNVSDENMDIEGGEGGEGEEGEEGLEGEEGGEENELDMDDESVEDFNEEPESATPESLLKSVMDMLKADAEAKKAQADAAAEEARAKQAEYSYKSAQATVAHEEEFARMELEADQQKQKEKDAKRLADLAKHRVQKVSAMRETNDSILGQVIMEIDDFDTQAGIQKQRVALRQKYQISMEDSPQTAQYKRQMLQQGMAELTARLKAVKTRDTFLANQKQQQKDQQQNQKVNAQTNLSVANNGAQAQAPAPNGNIR
jgi:hypothetical protein